MPLTMRLRTYKPHIPAPPQSYRTNFIYICVIFDWIVTKLQHYRVRRLLFRHNGRYDQLPV